MEAQRTLAPSLIPGGWRIAKWPWWVIVIVLAGITFITLIFSNNNYHQDFLFLVQGVYATLRITLFSYLIATVIGLLAGLARVSKNVFLFNLSTLYVEVVRGIPLVVMLLYIAFGVFPPLVELIQKFGNWGLTL